MNSKHIEAAATSPPAQQKVAAMSDLSKSQVKRLETLIAAKYEEQIAAERAKVARLRERAERAEARCGEMTATRCECRVGGQQYGDVVEWCAFHDELRQRIADLEAENAALMSEREWRPIETAPKDGTQIILRRGDRVTAGCWHEWVETMAEYHSNGTYLGNYPCDGGASWGSWDGGFTEEEPPIEWQPMPGALARWEEAREELEPKPDDK